jgi:hypothetical protein
MATTTPNFGWPVPTSTDLVKNGATAIEALGDAIDASLVDLEGGTTGQVLAKASNADMDFAWVAQDDSNAIQNSIVDAKGDLISATANDTPARLAVGSNGETLVADSSTSTGLRYQGSIAAGRNFLINGNYDIWQRGTTFSSPSSTAYTADRWNGGGSAGGTTTVSQQTTGVPVGSQYCYRTAYGAASSYRNNAQIIETANVSQLWGRTVTFSIKLRRNASFTGNLNFTIQKSATVDASTASTWTDVSGSDSIPNASLPTGTTSADWYTASKTVTIPQDGTANSLRCLIGEASVQGSGAYLEMAQGQLELGSVATTFSRAGGTIQGELAACQRYYWRWNAGATNMQLGWALSSTLVWFYVTPKVTPRVSPTSIDYANLQVYSGNTATNYSSGTFALSQANPEGFILSYTHGSGVFTANSVSNNLNGSGVSYLGFSAEL